MLTFRAQDFGFATDALAARNRAALQAALDAAGQHAGTEVAIDAPGTVSMSLPRI